MDHYIVRIYRRARQPPRQVVGIVEDVATGGSQAFHSIEELEAILGVEPRWGAREKLPKPRRRTTDFEPNE